MRISESQGPAGAGAGTFEFTATITSKSGNKISYNNAVGEDIRGEQRLLLDTSQSDTTCSVKGISGTPPIVAGCDSTGSCSCSTDWNTAFSGDLAANPTRYCFSLDSGASKYGSTQLYVHQIASASQFSLTLTDVVEGINVAWAGDATAGSYHIYPCSTTASLDPTGSLTVADATKFNTNDNIRMVLGDQAMTGINVVMDTNLPHTVANYGISLGSDGNSWNNRPIFQGINLGLNVSDSLIRFGGQGNGGAPLPVNGIVFDSGNWLLGTSLFTVRDTVNNNYIRLFGVNRNSGSPSGSYFSYNKQDDAYSFNGNAEISPVTGAAALGSSVQSAWQLFVEPPGSTGGASITLPNNSTADVFDATIGGIPSLRIYGNGSSNGSNWSVANGALLTGYSDNQATQKWQIDSSKGNVAVAASGHINQLAANGDTAHKFTLSGGSASYTFQTAFASTPVCVVSDETNAGAARLSALSAAAYTITSANASDVVDVICIGNAN